MKFKKRESENGVSKESSQSQLGPLPQNASSSSSMKTKKSSNLLSALVKRSKKKKAPQQNSDDVKSVCSSQTTQTLDDVFGSMEFVGFEIREEIEIDEEYFENTATTDSSDNSLSIKSKIYVTNALFNNQEKGEQIQPQDLSLKDIPCEECQGDTGETNQPEKIDTSIAPYQHFPQSNANALLTSSLELMKDLTSRLKDFESNLVQSLSKFIRDPTLQKQLIDSITHYSKFQWEAEKKTSVMINEMWMQQLELEKSHGRTLQDHLNSVIKQNRQLQIDNEVLFRKYERILMKFKNFVGENSLKQKCEEDSQIEQVFKRNEKLQHKLEEAYRLVETLENGFEAEKKKCQSLEEQLSKSSGQIHNLKLVINRSKTDFELEMVSLNHELKRREETIKEALAAGEVLIGDLGVIKNQIKDFDWERFKFKEGNLADMIQLCRSCLNEFCKGVLSLQTQLVIKDKDVENLQETNSKLQENLKKSASELDALSKKFEEEREAIRETDRVISEQRCQILETDMRAMKEKMEKMQIQFDMEKSAMLHTISHYEALKEDLQEKEKMIEQTRTFVCNVTSENLTLRSHINSLLESGAGDVMKELKKSQEKLAHYHAQYTHLLQEKQLGEKSLKTVQELYKDSQNSLKDLGSLKKDNDVLTQRYEAERRTVLSLQKERARYLEEKKLFETFFKHMKSEFQRVQKLETTVNDVSRQASKFALIAEYNKEIGDRLKTELAEKDKTILMLKTSVEKMSDVQSKEAKEKLTLCQEIAKLQKLKKQLSVEMQKNSILDTTRSKLAQSVKYHMRKIEEDKRNDRLAFNEMTNDMKAMASQKEALLKEINDLKETVTKLRQENEEQVRKHHTVVFAKNEVELKLKEAVTKSEENERLIKKLQEQLDREYKKHQEDIGSMKTLTARFGKEKEELQGSIKYLQNNIQKLHKDLNESRKNEKETKDKAKAMVEEVEKNQKSTDTLRAQNQKLTAEVANFNNLCEKILETFESNMKCVLEKEELFKKELEESRKIIFESNREIKKLSEKLNEKDEEIKRIEETYKSELASLKSQNHELNDNHQAFQEAYENLEFSVTALQKEQEDLQNCFKDIIVSKEREVINLRSKLEFMLKNKDAYEESNKKLLDELKDLASKSEEEKSELQQQINILLDGLNDEKNRINDLKQEKDGLQRKLDNLQMRYNDILKKCIMLENEFQEKNLANSNKSDCQMSGEFDATHCKHIIENLQREVTTSEFQKSELTLRLHELQKKLETEQNLCEQMRNTHKMVLMSVLRLKEDGQLDTNNCNHLIHMVQSSTSLNTDADASAS